MPEMPKHSVSVAGIVVNDRGQVLVIRRADNGHWEPPGGVLELDESFEHGVIREVHEENMARGVVAIVFRCTPASDAAPDSDEATSIRWLDPNAVTGLMDPAYAVRITDALHDGPPVTRVHDGVHLVRA
jgi:8-oxo-dGTP diphosphatase